MTEKQWTLFFSLVDDIANLPNMTAQDKGELLRDKAEENGSLSNLQEITSWLDD